jgi:hypothetical protein
MDDLKPGRRLTQAIHYGGGNPAADGVRAEYAGVDMKKFHDVTLGIRL